MQSMEAASLLEGIRNALSITWEDAETDRQLTGIIARGMAYLDEIAGHAVDYSAEGKARELLITYCMYARANALDQFEINYQPAITFFQIGEEVKLYAAEKAADTTV